MDLRNAALTQQETNAQTYLNWCIKSNISIDDTLEHDVVRHCFYNATEAKEFVLWLEAEPLANHPGVAQIRAKRVLIPNHYYDESSHSYFVVDVSKSQYESIMGKGSFNLLFTDHEFFEFIKDHTQTTYKGKKLPIYPELYEYRASLVDNLQQDRLTNCIVNQFRLFSLGFKSFNEIMNSSPAIHATDFLPAIAFLLRCKAKPIDINTLCAAFNALTAIQRRIALCDIQLYRATVHRFTVDEFRQLISHFTPEELKLYLAPPDYSRLVDNAYRIIKETLPEALVKIKKLNNEKFYILVDKLQEDDLDVLFHDQPDLVNDVIEKRDDLSILKKLSPLTQAYVFSQAKLTEQVIAKIALYLMKSSDELHEQSSQAESYRSNLFVKLLYPQLLNELSRLWLLAMDLPKKLIDIIKQHHNEDKGHADEHSIPSSLIDAMLGNDEHQEEKHSATGTREIRTSDNKYISVDDMNFMDKLFIHGIAWRDFRYLRHLKKDGELQQMLTFMELTKTIHTGIRGAYRDFMHLVPVRSDLRSIDQLVPLQSIISALEKMKKIRKLGVDISKKTIWNDFLFFNQGKTVSTSPPTPIVNIMFLVLIAYEDMKENNRNHKLLDFQKIAANCEIWNKVHEKTNKCLTEAEESMMITQENKQFCRNERWKLR